MPQNPDFQTFSKNFFTKTLIYKGFKFLNIFDKKFGTKGISPSSSLFQKAKSLDLFVIKTNKIPNLFFKNQFSQKALF